MPPDASIPQTAQRPACPICGKPAEADYSPFCSKRCADIDLNRWLGGVYAIPAGGADEDEDGEAPQQSGR
ncbi:MAG: DNA gyrase inhibitor YacG [Methylobacteriaceae bacterium]|nr:DNA gyrase inhibitor YacG [Methylobacteriaceae bacterium]